MHTHAPIQAQTHTHMNTHTWSFRGGLVCRRNESHCDHSGSCGHHSPTNTHTQARLSVCVQTFPALTHTHAHPPPPTRTQSCWLSAHSSCDPSWSCLWESGDATEMEVTEEEEPVWWWGWGRVWEPGWAQKDGEVCMQSRATGCWMREGHGSSASGDSLMWEIAKEQE